MDGLHTTVNEFETFIRYIETEKPQLSLKHGILGKNDAYHLNEMLEYKREVKGPNYTQPQYPEVDLIFFLATAGRLYERGNNEKGEPALLSTDALDEFKALNDYEKYVYLLQTYWTKYDFKGNIGLLSSSSLFNKQLKAISKADVGERITKKDTDFPAQYLYYEGSLFFYHLRFFRFGELDNVQGVPRSQYHTVGTFIPNQLGIHVSKGLNKHTIDLWNVDLWPEEPHPAEETNPFEAFKKIFPGEVERTVTLDGKIDRSGVYTLTVRLHKDCWRKIVVSYQDNLDDLHDVIQDAFNLDNDHLYAFFVNGTKKTGTPIYCPFMQEKKAEGELMAGETTFEDLGLFKGQKLYYLFDFGDEWNFDITVNNIDKNAPLPELPKVIEEKGKAPEQYPPGKF